MEFETEEQQVEAIKKWWKEYGLTIAVGLVLGLGGIFGFRAAGFFDGSVHVRGVPRIDERLVRTLHHEYTHAALHSVSADAFPAWLWPQLPVRGTGIESSVRRETCIRNWSPRVWLTGAISQLVFVIGPPESGKL